MTDYSSKYCPACGAALPPDAVFCESCGARIGREGREEQAHGFSTAEPGLTPPPKVPVSESLPDVDIPPRLANALDVSWNMLWQDIVGSSLVGLVYILIAIASSLLSIFSFVVAGPLTVGFLGWAEARRTGSPAGVSEFLNCMFKYLPNAILLAVAKFVISLVFLVPGFILYFVFLFGMTGALGGPGSPPMPFQNFQSISPILIGILLVLFVIGAVILGPLLYSLEALAGWAIVKGKKFQEAFLWGWERIKRHFFGWWFAGLIIPFYGGMGVILCYIGILASLPLMPLAWVEIIGNTERDIQN